MFTLDQIHEAHRRVKSGADFPQYVRELKALGVLHYDNYVADGQTEYFGSDNFSLRDKPKYPPIAVNTKSSAEKLRQAISIHQQGHTDYPTFCLQAAEAGVEKWTTHMAHMQVIYLDKNGNTLTVEPIPQKE